jgi:hypothetical protein
MGGNWTYCVLPDYKSTQLLLNEPAGGGGGATTQVFILVTFAVTRRQLLRLLCYAGCRIRGLQACNQPSSLLEATATQLKKWVIRGYLLNTYLQRYNYACRVENLRSLTAFMSLGLIFSSELRSSDLVYLNAQLFRTLKRKRKEDDVDNWWKGGMGE